MRRVSKQQFNSETTHRKKKGAAFILRLLCSILTASVYFVLAQPGITIDGDTVCGFEAHVHNNSCYENMLRCGLNEGPNGTSDHISACYNTVSKLVSRNLTCPKPEILSTICLNDNCSCLLCLHAEECYFDCSCLLYTHTNDCFADVYEDISILNCLGACLPPSHTHTVSCYEQRLNCLTIVHTHIDTCFAPVFSFMASICDFCDEDDCLNLCHIDECES